jgi:hypothetical protein
MSYRARCAATAFGAIVLALLPACHRDAGATPAGNNVHGFVPPTPMPAKPLPGQTPLTSLDAYLGHDPHEPIDGVEFFDRTDVSTALIATVKDERVRRHFRESSGAMHPIFAHGKQIAVAGCVGQTCAGGNWTFLIDRNTGKGQACFHDAAMGAASHWYDGGGKPVARGGNCPTA